MHRLRHCQPATALTVVMAFHHRSVGPQTRQACYGRDHPVNLSTWRSRTSPPTRHCADRRHGASSPIRRPHARHVSIGAARRQRLVGVTGTPRHRGHRGHRQPVTALTVIMAIPRERSGRPVRATPRLLVRSPVRCRLTPVPSRSAGPGQAAAGRARSRRRRCAVPRLCRCRSGPRRGLYRQLEQQGVAGGELHVQVFRLAAW